MDIQYIDIQLLLNRTRAIFSYAVASTLHLSAYLSLLSGQEYPCSETPQRCLLWKRADKLESHVCSAGTADEYSALFKPSE